MNRFLMRLVGGAAVALLALQASAFAGSVAVRDEDDVYLGEAAEIKAGNGVIATFDGSKASLAITTTMEKQASWTPADFSITGSSTSQLPLTNSSSPQLSKKAGSAMAYVKWVDNITSPVQKKFRVPADYVSGGAFRVMLGRSGNGAPPAIDYQVFIDKDGTAFDSAATDQTAVALSTSSGSGSPELKTLSIATDFASLAAGDIVTVEFWRDNTNTSTEDLELYYAEFFYTAKNNNAN